MLERLGCPFCESHAEAPPAVALAGVVVASEVKAQLSQLRALLSSGFEGSRSIL
jgi:hypothetical protein